MSSQNSSSFQMSSTASKDGGGGPHQPPSPQFKVKTSNTIQFMRQTSLTKIGGLLNSMNKKDKLQRELSNPGKINLLTWTDHHHRSCF